MSLLIIAYDLVPVFCGLTARVFCGVPFGGNLGSVATQGFGFWWCCDCHFGCPRRICRREVRVCSNKACPWLFRTCLYLLSECSSDIYRTQKTDAYLCLSHGVKGNSRKNTWAVFPLGSGRDRRIWRAPLSSRDESCQCEPSTA